MWGWSMNSAASGWPFAVSIASIGGTRKDHHIGFGKHLSCLGGEEHGVMLLFALRADEPWALNGGMVAVMLHLPRENLHVCVLHRSNAIPQSVQTRDGVVVFAQLLNDILYARRFRLN
jgi:hypothetical protein